MTDVGYFLARLREVAGNSARAFAARCGGEIKERTLRNWLEGKGGPDPGELMLIAKTAGRDVSWFFPHGDSRLAQQLRNDVVMVPVLDARASAGSGALNGDHIVAVDYFPFPERFIRRLGGVPGRVAAIRPEGDSMEPTIRSGALVLIDYTKQKLPDVGGVRIRDDDIYVFQTGSEYEKETRIKRLQRLATGDKIALVSDNPEHMVEVVDPKDIWLVGQAIWWDNRL